MSWVFCEMFGYNTEAIDYVQGPIPSGGQQRKWSVNIYIRGKSQATAQYFPDRITCEAFLNLVTGGAYGIAMEVAPEAKRPEKFIGKKTDVEVIEYTKGS